MIDAKVLTIGFDAISKKMSENRMHLISIDQQIGDGDLGISMDNGFKAAADMCCANADTADIGKLLFLAGKSFNEAAPSSLGTIISMLLIAERFWVNPSYLSRYFKTYMGINIVQYIRSMRIFYAKSLLQSSDMSIAEVAEMVGIKSASHFSKIFENEVGESPSKFRKSYFDRNHS